MLFRFLLICSQAGAAFAVRPNVLFICVDDLRPEIKVPGAGDFSPMPPGPWKTPLQGMHG